MSQAVGTAECVNLFLRSQGTGRPHQNKTVNHLPVLTRTNYLCESDYKASCCCPWTGCPALKLWLIEMVLQHWGCPAWLQPPSTCQLGTAGAWYTLQRLELQCGTELALPAQSTLCVKHLTLLNNRVGLPVVAKLASCNRDDDIFAFGIFCFWTTSNFPPWCQERFLSTSPGRSQIRTAVLYLCYLYKKVSLPTAFISFTKGNVELNRIYIKVSSNSFTFSAVLSLGICLRGGPNPKGTILFSLYCHSDIQKVHQRDDLKATNTSSMAEVPWSGKITSG